MTLRNTEHPVVVRTSYDDEAGWAMICQLIRAPVEQSGETFYAYLELFEGDEFRNVTPEDLLRRVPNDYNHSFLLVVDKFATQHQEFAILVIDLFTEPGRKFRAIPSQIQGIENNLSIANMSFFEFADDVDSDGIFRGFPDP